MGLIDKKKEIESKAVPNPGVNTKRKFNNVNFDIIKSPVDIPKYSGRKPFYEQVPVLDGPHPERFVPFNSIPDVNSKYKFPQVPNFENYSYRVNPEKELKEADRAQIAIQPNKDYVMKSLTLGFTDFKMQQSRL
jgi:hypothetical protein